MEKYYRAGPVRTEGPYAYIPIRLSTEKAPTAELALSVWTLGELFAELKGKQTQLKTTIAPKEQRCSECYGTQIVYVYPEDWSIPGARETDVPGKPDRVEVPCPACTGELVVYNVSQSLIHFVFEDLESTASYYRIPEDTLEAWKNYLEGAVFDASRPVRMTKDLADLLYEVEQDAIDEADAWRYA
jgi:hypothetical protein